MVYGSGALIEQFEKKIAAVLGMEAAVFCISGTMAQVTALRDAINSAPKSARWKLRAAVGERQQWYVEPEEVGHN